MNHGLSMYKHRGCKCDICRAANAAYSRSLRNRTPEKAEKHRAANRRWWANRRAAA